MNTKSTYISNKDLAEIIRMNGVRQYSSLNTFPRTEKETGQHIYLWNNVLWKWRKIEDIESVESLCY